MIRWQRVPPFAVQCIATAGILSLCFFATPCHAAPPLRPELIAAQIFLGQSYPSGNVYLTTFPLQSESENEKDNAKAWPSIVRIQSLSEPSPEVKKVTVGRFLNAMSDGKHEIGPNLFQLESAYIPGLEAMDDVHEGCTKKLYKPKNAEFRYLGEDFFWSVLDNCNPNEGIAIYQSGVTGKISFSVLAFDSKLQLANITLLKGEKRPLTPGEQAEVKKAKLQFAKEEDECTTVPQHLDAAVTFLSANVQGTDISIRLSRYSNPGCGGHLAKMYILDVFKSGVLVKKFEKIQYEGVI